MEKIINKNIENAQRIFKENAQKYFVRFEVLVEALD